MDLKLALCTFRGKFTVRTLDFHLYTIFLDGGTRPSDLINVLTSLKLVQASCIFTYEHCTVQDKKCEKILLPQRTIFFLHALLKFYTCCRSYSIIELHLSPLRKNSVFKLLTNNTVQYCTLYCICMQLCIFAMSKCAPSWNACTYFRAFNDCCHVWPERGQPHLPHTHHILYMS